MPIYNFEDETVKHKGQTGGRQQAPRTHVMGKFQSYMFAALLNGQCIATQALWTILQVDKCNWYLLFLYIIQNTLIIQQIVNSYTL